MTFYHFLVKTKKKSILNRKFLDKMVNRRDIGTRPQNRRGVPAKSGGTISLCKDRSFSDFLGVFYNCKYIVYIFINLD